MIDKTVHVLTPLQYISEKLGPAKIMLTKTDAASLMIGYFNYRQDLQNKGSNKYAQSIGLLKAVIILIEKNQPVSASLVLIESGYNARELLSRLSQLVDYDLYNPPRKISSFIRHTLSGTKTGKLLPPIMNTDNNYLVIDDTPYPIVTMDINSTVMCPYCGTRHKHRLTVKRLKNHSLPDGHFHLPCYTHDTPPLKMYDGTLCFPNNGYIIQNFMYNKLNHNLTNH